LFNTHLVLHAVLQALSTRDDVVSTERRIVGSYEHVCLDTENECVVFGLLRSARTQCITFTFTGSRRPVVCTGIVCYTLTDHNAVE